MDSGQDMLPNKEENEKNENSTPAVSNESAAVNNETTDEVAESSETPKVHPAKAEVESATEVDATDEEMEAEDDTAEVHSDEDEHDEHEVHELVLPDYSHYEGEALVAEAEKLLKSEPIQKLKNHFDEIRKSLLKQLNDERKSQLDAFIEQGGVEMDFEYIQPLREKFRSIFSDYRNRRQKHYKELQDTLENNLRIKLALIEKIKEIVTKDESIGDTFKEFNALQQEWRNTGPVPRNDSNDLWRTYHHHVENFYEFIKINKELRDLDFKKNKEAKEALIVKAEALAEIERISDAFKTLQGLHKQWKNIGPVERELREPLWEKFSEVTKTLHDKREAHFEELREKATELIEKKRALIAEVKAYDVSQINSHQKWQDGIKQMETFREAFRKIGRIHHPDNDAIWDEFRASLRNFNHLKNDYYKAQKKQHHDNLGKKRALVEAAEGLKESDDWKNTTNQYKKLQADWKKIGHVPKSESDKIWKQFRGACNHFFDRLTAHNKDRDASFVGNYDAKVALLETLKALKPEKEKQAETVKELKKMIGQWKSIGMVPRDKMGIESDFNKALDAQFKAVDLDRKESQRIRFENKMDGLSSGGNDRALTRERQAIRNQMDEATRELNQLETNMSFFSSSSPNSPLLKEANKNINRQKEQIEQLKEQLKMVTIKIREIAKANEPQPETDAGEGAENTAESSE